MPINGRCGGLMAARDRGQSGWDCEVVGSQLTGDDETTSFFNEHSSPDGKWLKDRVNLGMHVSDATPRFFTKYCLLLEIKKTWPKLACEARWQDSRGGRVCLRHWIKGKVGDGGAGTNHCDQSEPREESHCCITHVNLFQCKDKYSLIDWLKQEILVVLATKLRY